MLRSPMVRMVMTMLMVGGRQMSTVSDKSNQLPRIEAIVGTRVDVRIVSAKDVDDKTRSR